MRAVGYAETGGVEVLQNIDLPVRDPGRGEVRVRIARSGVNPTDWKSRNGAIHMPIPAGRFQVPHLDGAGTVEAQQHTPGLGLVHQAGHLGLEVRAVQA